ncbi:unnamed protein product [Microthlaspi erraticum]|uniref:Uncharacterized protein n=1 Tax=Microthlaspi erraticum TaxID=1685480 RepID=A0A6D2I1J1_9BRAS|nr:unnamed protein product [Microthlaspi erraticum]
MGEGLGGYKEYVAGMMAGLATVAVGHPFDTVKAAVEKTEGKKLMTEEGFDSKKGGRSAVMRAKDYKNIFKKMPFVGTRYPDQSAMADI